MNRTKVTRPKKRATRRRHKTVRRKAQTTLATRSNTTQALRMEAQIAMLKRALLAAEDEGLPHKAICDYLHTLSQMAKLEQVTAPGARNAAVLESAMENDVHPSDAPESPQETANPTEVRARLRQAIADIYGISVSPEAGSSPAHSNKASDVI